MRATWGNQAGLPCIRPVRNKGSACGTKGLSSDAGPTPPEGQWVESKPSPGLLSASLIWRVLGSLHWPGQAGAGVQRRPALSPEAPAQPSSPQVPKRGAGKKDRHLARHSSEDTVPVPSEHPLWYPCPPTVHQVWPWTSLLRIQPRGVPSSWAEALRLGSFHLGFHGSQGQRSHCGGDLAACWGVLQT